jgi:hypothetical protein
MKRVVRKNYHSILHESIRICHYDDTWRNKCTYVFVTLPKPATFHLGRSCWRFVLGRVLSPVQMAAAAVKLTPYRVTLDDRLGEIQAKYVKIQEVLNAL